jgi:glutaredoxin 3
MSRVEIYTKDWCGYCSAAKRLLDALGVAYEEIDVTRDPTREREMIERARRRTVPQVFVDGSPIGGYDDLERLRAKGELDRLLGRSGADG